MLSTKYGDKDEADLPHLLPDGKMYFTPRDTYGGLFIFKTLNELGQEGFFNDLLKSIQKDTISAEFLS